MLRKGIAALAVVFLIAHLPFLPPSLEDLDSINFALGVRDFDVGRHQPHPPGYPIFIVASKASTALFRAASVPSPASRGLAVWSTLSGAALVVLLFGFLKALDGSERRAFWATAIAVTSPLFWFTALRPLSDMMGLAGAVAALALIVAAMQRRDLTPERAGRMLMAGGFAAGLVIGLRSQTLVLTLPVLALAIIRPVSVLPWRNRVAALLAVGLGALVWAIPLVIASGGIGAYLAAVGSQAGEDFSGVPMLWTTRTPRVALEAAKNTFLWPWGTLVLGGVVCALAAIGAVRLAVRMPRVLLVVLVAFVPYAIFHLLFHEIVTVRYALPLVVPIAYFIAVALDASRRALPAGAAVLIVLFLWVTFPATLTYGREASPTFRGLHDFEYFIAQPLEVDGLQASGRFIAMHAFARRAGEWESDRLAGRVLKAPHGREWLAAVDELRRTGGLAFLADPRRTDLALFDPHRRRLVESYRWGFTEPPFVGGARPGNADLHSIMHPGWMLDRGWALTAEVAGVTARDGYGPHRRPSVAWIARRAGDALLMIGGRHLGAATDPHVRLTATLDGRRLDTWDVAPGFFVRRLTLPAGSLNFSSAYAPLEIRSEASDGSARPIEVGLEQFDLQPPGMLMMAFEEGWQEPEYNPLTTRSWRWMSERGVLWVRPIGRDVTLTLTGESPLLYFDAAPTVTVTLGNTVVRRFSPASDFAQQIVLPAAALSAADGRVVIESDRHFVPADREGTADRRHLALRTWSVAVD